MNKKIKWNEAARERLGRLRFIFETSKGNGVTEDQRNELNQLYDLEHSDDLRRFGELVDWLTRVLYKSDPIDLVPCVVPRDEYDIEAKMILREISIRGKPSLKEIVEVIYEIFSMQFGYLSSGTIDRPCYELIGKELINRRKEWQGK